MENNKWWFTTLMNEWRGNSGEMGTQHLGVPFKHLFPLWFRPSDIFSHRVSALCSKPIPPVCWLFQGQQGEPERHYQANGAALAHLLSLTGIESLYWVTPEDAKALFHITGILSKGKKTKISSLIWESKSQGSLSVRLYTEEVSVLLHCSQKSKQLIYLLFTFVFHT